MTQLFMTHPGPLDAPVLPLAAGLAVREATDDDAATVARVLTEAFDEAWDEHRVRTELLASSEVVRTWVATNGARLVGTASERLHAQHPLAGYVHWVGVVPEARGAQLGRILTQRCLNGFAERGLPRAVLETDDFRLPAVRSYLSLGFIPEYRSDLERAAWSALFQQLGAPATPTRGSR